MIIVYILYTSMYNIVHATILLLQLNVYFMYNNVFLVNVCIVVHPVPDVECLMQ